MYTHPYIVMTVANDRVHRLRAMASAHRLVHTTRVDSNAARINWSYRPAASANKEQTRSCSVGQLTTGGAS